MMRWWVCVWQQWDEMLKRVPSPGAAFSLRRACSLTSGGWCPLCSPSPEPMAEESLALGKTCLYLTYMTTSTIWWSRENSSFLCSGGVHGEPSFREKGEAFGQLGWPRFWIRLFWNVLSGPRVLHGDLWIENHRCLWLLAGIPSSLWRLLLGPPVPSCKAAQSVRSVEIQTLSTEDTGGNHTLLTSQSYRWFGLLGWVQSSGLTYSILVPHSYPISSHHTRAVLYLCWVSSVSWALDDTSALPRH